MAIDEVVDEADSTVDPDAMDASLGRRRYGKLMMSASYAAAAAPPTFEPQLLPDSRIAFDSMPLVLADDADADASAVAPAVDPAAAS